MIYRILLSMIKSRVNLIHLFATVGKMRLQIANEENIQSILKIVRIGED